VELDRNDNPDVFEQISSTDIILPTMDVIVFIISAIEESAK